MTRDQKTERIIRLLEAVVEQLERIEKLIERKMKGPK